MTETGEVFEAAKLVMCMQWLCSTCTERCHAVEEPWAKWHVGMAPLTVHAASQAAAQEDAVSRRTASSAANAFLNCMFLIITSFLLLAMNFRPLLEHSLAMRHVYYGNSWSGSTGIGREFRYAA
jgi:hypothetical protein